MSSYAIEAEGLGKRYRLYTKPHRRVLEALSFGAWRGHKELWALRNLDLKLPRGSVLGVCGQNGAGKSTLLRILCGTTFPSEGRYRVNGRVNGMLDLAAGIQHDASGRANIRYQGMLLGWRRSAIQKKTEEIIEFSELGDFIDDPLRTYSAGMAMRLAFSVAALMDPDVLILDEVFAVGDVAFQKRCIDRIQSFRTANKTILFCGHSMYDIRQLCDRAIWLRDGELAAEGDVVSVTGQYTSYMREREDLPSAEAAASDAPPADQPHVVTAQMHLTNATETASQNGEPVEITTGDSLAVHVDWRNPGESDRPLHVGIGVVREDGTVCIGLGSSFDHVSLSGEEGTAILRMPNLQLLSGRYLVLVWLLDETGAHRFHEFILERKLIVTATTQQMGVFIPEHEWEVESR